MESHRICTERGFFKLEPDLALLVLQHIAKRCAAPRTGGPPLHLHSREVTVPISKNKAPVTVIAPVPGHMREKLAACGFTQ